MVDESSSIQELKQQARKATQIRTETPDRDRQWRPISFCDTASAFSCHEREVLCMRFDPAACEQIGLLENKLGVLHTSDVNALRRAHTSLVQHIESLLIEVHDAQAAAAQLDGHAPVFTGERCAKEAAQTLGLIWLGSVLTAFLRGSFKLGARASRSLYLVSFLTATVPLGVKAHKRLRNLILRNPRVVDDLKAALSRVEERATIMDDLTADQQAAPSEQQQFQSSGRLAADEADVPSRESGSTPDDLVHVSAADCVSSPDPSGNLAVLSDAADARGTDAGSSALAEVQPERSGGLVGVQGGASDSARDAPLVSMPGDDSDAFAVLSG